MNPYESPVAVDDHPWLNFAPWLRRFLIAVGVIIAVVAIYDVLYMHRMTKPGTSSRFSGWEYREVFEQWWEDEFNPPE